jgi:hypothetical protein
MKAMKKALILFLLTCWTATAFGAEHLIVSAGLSYLQPADSGYRGIYGESAFYPEVEAGVRLSRGLYLMGGFGTLTKTGSTPDLGLPARSTQRFFSAGLAFLATISGGLKFKVQAGAVDIGYKEEAMETTVSGSSLGWQGKLGILWMGKIALAGVDLGYMTASDTVDGLKIKLGGARASIYVGFRI